MICNYAHKIVIHCNETEESEEEDKKKDEEKMKSFLLEKSVFKQYDA